MNKKISLFDDERQYYGLTKRRYNEILNIRNDLKVAWEEKQKRVAAEIIVAYIMKHNTMYTIRDSSKTEIWIYREGIYVPNGQTYIEEELRKLLGPNYIEQHTKEVIKKIKSDTMMDSDEFFNPNTDTHEIAVKNCILDLKNSEIIQFTPERRHFAKLPMNYDKNAKSDEISKFVLSICGDDQGDARNTIFELFGYLLMRENKYEKAFMFSGRGSNGKSKLIELMKIFLGRKNCTNISLHEIDENQYAAGELVGKLANMGGDISSKKMTEGNVLKGLIGRDNIQVQRKYLPMISFKNYAKLVFSCNIVPEPNEDTAAFWRRWIFVEFPYTFISQKEFSKLRKTNSIKEILSKGYKVADPDIVEKISTQKNLSGMLNLAIANYHNLEHQKEFSLSSKISHEELRSDWLSRSNSFIAFMKDNIIESPDCVIEKSVLRREYILYCRKNDTPVRSDKMIAITLYKNTLAETTQRVVKANGPQVRCWEGIILKNLKIEKKDNNTEDIFDKKSENFDEFLE